MLGGLRFLLVRNSTNHILGFDAGISCVAVMGAPAACLQWSLNRKHFTRSFTPHSFSDDHGCTLSVAYSRRINMHTSKSDDTSRRDWVCRVAGGRIDIYYIARIPQLNIRLYYVNQYLNSSSPYPRSRRERPACGCVYGSMCLTREHTYLVPDVTRR
jgi:hypothetical protein